MKQVSLRELMDPSERQSQAIEAVRDHLFTLYGGAGGGGKSYFLRWILAALLLKWAKEGHRGVRVGLFSMDYPTLQDRQLSKVRSEFPDWLGRYNGQTREFVLSPRFGGGVIAFRNLDDPSKYKSAEFAAIAVEELTELTRDDFNALFWRRRWPGIRRCPFIGATNPTGVGHGWVKKLWIERDFTDEPEALDAAEFAYVPAKASDNPHLPPEYLRTLDALPEDMRAALRDGSWDVFAGQVFSEFRREIHVEEPWQLPPGTRYFTAGDRGMTAASVILRFAMLPDGDLRVISELYETGLITSALGGRWQAIGPGEYAVMDPAVWGRITTVFQGQGESEAEVLMRDYGLPLRQADNDRINGLHRVHEWLKHVPGRDGKPSCRLKIWPTCPNLIRELPQLVYDKTRAEDVDDDSGIHHADAYSALRYGLMSRPNPGEATAGVPTDAPPPRRWDPLAEDSRPSDGSEWA